MHDMARIVITTFGSTGDLNPFIALGLALRSNGHDVLFAQMIAWATARPATRPEKRQPPRNVPSNDR
jgi:hypothetical protein